MSMESQGVIIQIAVIQQLGEKPFPLPLYTPQMLLGRAVLESGLRIDRSATNRLSHVTAKVS
jgi:hypothetical protein